MAFELNLPSNLSDATSASLRVIEFKELDFIPARIYWMSNFVEGTSRGNHAHKALRQAFFVMRGSVDIDLFWGETKTTYRLSEESKVLRIDAGYWRVIRNASSDCILAVLADQAYDESDYIRSWESYQLWFQSGRQDG